MSSKRKWKSQKQKRLEDRERRERQRLEKLAAEGRLANGLELPEGAVAADLSKQAPNNSYDPPRYYVDQPFTCVDCGSSEVWTAQQQKWYYEVAKGSIYGRAVRCRNCRRRHRSQRTSSESAES